MDVEAAEAPVEEIAAEPEKKKGKKRSSAAGSKDAAKKGGKKKIVLIVLPVLVIGVAAKMFILAPKHTGAKGAVAASPSPIEGAIVPVEPVTVGLSDPSPHYARVGVALVFTLGADSKTAADKLPLFQDQMITAIGRFSSGTLRRQSGQEALRRALEHGATSVFPDGAVMKVAFTELVVD